MIFIQYPPSLQSIDLFEYPVKEHQTGDLGKRS